MLPVHVNNAKIELAPNRNILVNGKSSGIRLSFVLNKKLVKSLNAKNKSTLLKYYKSSNQYHLKQYDGWKLVDVMIAENKVYVNDKQVA